MRGWCCGKPCGVGRRDVMGGGTFYLAATRAFVRVSLQRFPSLPPEIRNHCSIWADSGEILASIPKSGPEIKNHCSRGAVSWRNLAVILKLTPSNQESLQLWDCFWVIPCSDSQIDPMKSRITAAFGLFPRKSMHRFPSLGLKLRIDACSRPSSARVH